MGRCISKKDLSAFIDSELPPRAMEAVRAHLRTCSACADYVEGLRKQSAALRALPTVPVRSSLAAQVRRRIAWEDGLPYGRRARFLRRTWRCAFRPISWVFPRLRVVPVALALVVAVGAAVFWGGHLLSGPETADSDPFLKAYMEDYDAYRQLTSWPTVSTMMAEKE